MKSKNLIITLIILIILVVGISIFSFNNNINQQEPIKIGVIVYPGFAPFFICR